MMDDDLIPMALNEAIRLICDNLLAGGMLTGGDKKTEKSIDLDFSGSFFAY